MPAQQIETERRGDGLFAFDIAADQPGLLPDTVRRREDEADFDAFGIVMQPVPIALCDLDEHMIRAFLPP